jgi:hypothetical protein
MHVCPVCGFNQLRDAPANFTICPCCGTEFELDDAFATHAELQAAWVSKGARWWSRSDLPPEGWNANTQLRNIASSLSPAWHMVLTMVGSSVLSLPTLASSTSRTQFVSAQFKPSTPDMFRRPAKQSQIETFPEHRSSGMAGLATIQRA